MSFISLFLCVESLPSYNKTHLSCGWVMNCPTLQNSDEIRSLKFQKHSCVLLNIECILCIHRNFFEIFSKNTGCTILQNPVEIRISKYVNQILIFQKHSYSTKIFSKTLIAQLYGAQRR